jgi:MFS family permease
MSLPSPPSADHFLDKYQPAPGQTRRQRILRLAAGVVYGLLLGMLYALVSGTIDAVTFPDLPLRVDWKSLWSDIAISGAGGMVLGAVAAWPENALAGTLAGAAAIVTWEMLRSLLRLSSPLGLVLAFLVLPLVVLSLPIAAIFRWSVSRHWRVMQRPRLRRRLVGLGGLVLTIIALATFAGSWSRMAGASEDAVRKVNTVVKIALASSGQQMPDAFKTVPNFQARASHTYWLSQQASSVFPTGIDVQVAFDNGYVLTCLVETETGQARIVTCLQGDQTGGGSSSAIPHEQQR